MRAKQFCLICKMIRLAYPAMTVSEFGYLMKQGISDD